jgi:FRG domain
MSEKPIQSIEEFLKHVREDAADWPTEQPRWFRGESNEFTTPLLPSLYRLSNDRVQENQLLQTFRAKAPGFSTERLPNREHTDQWLYLAQHCGLPTRLLDWTEAALVGLYFALTYGNPVIWMLNPLELNNLTFELPECPQEFLLPWHRPKHGTNPAMENVSGAWGDKNAVPFPMAIQPQYVHTRLSAQRSVFTVHGTRKESINIFASSRILKKYKIDPHYRDEIKRDLTILGITESVVSPDLDGLAIDLKRQFLSEST